MTDNSLLDETKDSLQRIQNFDTNALSRREELGRSFNFEDAVPHVKRVIALFSRIPTDILDQFPDQQLNAVKQQADIYYNLLKSILEFDPAEPDAAIKRKQLITQADEKFQQIFTSIHPFISYAVARTADFGAIADEGRATVQAVSDKVDALLNEIAQKGDEADRVLQEVRNAAAERGVSQEAFHFSNAADEHAKLAEKWEKTTKRWAILLGLFAFASVFFHRIPWLAPTNTLETAQYVVSKILIFGVIAYMLGLSAKNYLSHKHNEIVNRHRQNSLMTYQSISNAASEEHGRDIILQHAAAAIYQLHDTGYVKSTSSSNNTTVTEMLPKATLPLTLGGHGSS